MSASPISTRQRIIQAALQLFAAQGVTETTTKQIAETAGVNEVTLFRHFGNKHGLLLAVIEEAAVFTQLGQTLIQKADPASSIYQALNDYATACLQALERVPEVVRSVVGEAGQFPSENRAALGRGFTQANRYVADYFQAVIDQGQLQTHLTAEKLASLLNGMLLGYAVIEFTSEFHNLWQDRKDFLENLVTLFLNGAVSAGSPILPAPILPAPILPAPILPAPILPAPIDLGRNHSDFPPDQVPAIVTDLAADRVAELLQTVKKIGLREYALVYVLFGSGVTPAEIVQLHRSHYENDTHHQVLKVVTGNALSPLRYMPINQWILGKRYGSYTRNPLTQWLKSRKDSQPSLFLNTTGEPLTESELRQQWQDWIVELTIPTGEPIAIEQTQQTWCVEMLGRGMTPADLAILMGWDVSQLQPYVTRAREKAALEQAMRLDQRRLDPKG